MTRVRRFPASNRNDDLADEIARGLATVRVGGFVEGENFIHDGLDFVHVNGAIHVFEHRAAADADADHGAALHHENGGIDIAFTSREKTDEGHLAAECAGFE